MRGLTSLPFAPPPGDQPLLPKNASASAQFGRLLDALLVLDAEGSCRISELAARVGLEPVRLRELLSVYMTAGSDVVESPMPLTVSFGTSEGPLSGDEEDDDAQSSADVVWLETSQKGWLVGELGRQPVMVKDVARALLAAALIAEDEDVPAARRLEVQALAARLSQGLGASVHPPAGSAAADVQEAVRRKQVVRFRYLHPWTGEAATVQVSPYDVRRRRDRLVLDAGSGTELLTFDLGQVSDLVVVDAPYQPMALPPVSERTPRVPVTIRVPLGSNADSWLCDAWGGLVQGRAGDDEVDIRVELDGDVTDEGVVRRLGLLLLQLGPGCSVQSPEELRSAARDVGRRLLELHP